jgi:predicted nucleic acid-binding protein
MIWLLDTNALLRLADGQSPDHAAASAAIERLLASGETVFIGAQVLAEFWAVARLLRMRGENYTPPQRTWKEMVT